MRYCSSNTEITSIYSACSSSGKTLYHCGKTHTIVFLPGDTPVRFNLEDGGIIGIVELDLWVPQLSRVDVHHDRGGA